MKIGITINEVVRDYHEKMFEVFTQYNIGEPTIDSLDEFVDLDKLEDYLPITKNEEIHNIINLSDLLYTQASVEISSGAGDTDEDFVDIYNDFIFDFYAHEGNEITFVSKEFNRSVGATLFFLAKTGLQIRKVDLVETYKNIWEHYDLIITADPNIIKTKPKDKKVIKINTTYNKSIECDLSFDKISDVFTQYLNK